MLVDPRYAYIPELIEPNSWHDVEEELLVSENLNDKSNETTFVADSVPSTSSQIQTPRLSGGLRELLNRKLKTKDLANDLSTEILKYKAVLNSTRPSPETNPLHFWSTHQDNFPKLTKIAKSLLAAPASSSVSERLFRWACAVDGKPFFF